MEKERFFQIRNEHKFAAGAPREVSHRSCEGVANFLSWSVDITGAL